MGERPSSWRTCTLGVLAWPCLAAAAPMTQLDTVTVVGKIEQPLAKVAATVSVISAADIERSLSSDLRDLVRLEPGLSVGTDPSRFGSGALAIRGLGGNRVLLETDGVPAASGFAVGSYSNAGRHFAELELVRRVEILRGPASSLYGSDAIAGVVTTTTIDPADLLRGAERTAVRVRAGYSSDDDSWFSSLAGAARTGATDWLLAWGQRRGHAQDIASATVDPNPRESSSDAVLLRAVHQVLGRPLRVTAGWERGTHLTQVDSLELSPGRFANTLVMAGNDRAESVRLLLDQDLPGVRAFERLQWRLYWQQSESLQLTGEERRAVPPRTPRLAIEREFRFRERVGGGELTLLRPLSTAAGPHRLTAGAEFSVSRIDELRDGLQTNLETGGVTQVLLGESMPVRDFPGSEIVEAGLYAQDEFRPGDGRLSIIPALRLDWYRLIPHPDAIYQDDNARQVAVSVDQLSLSPKLGVSFDIRDDAVVFLQYAHGFRAQPFEDVNIGLDLPAFNVRAIPNPGLQPERSHSLEAGVRLSGAAVSGTVSLYYSRYRDFIESKVNLGPDPVTGTTLFQSRNVSRAEIRGAEATLTAQLSSLNPVLDGWSAWFAAGYARGDDTVRDVPINSVGPLHGSAGLRYEDAAGRLGLELSARGASSKGRVDDPRAVLFKPGGFFSVDLTARWTVAKSWRINAGIFNLADSSHFEWADVYGRETSDPLLEYYRRPGRHWSVSLTAEF